MWGSAIHHLLGFMAGVVLLVAAAGAKSPSPLPSPGVPGEGVKTQTAVIEIRGEIDDYMRDAVAKRFAAARAVGAKVVILDINTPGGLVTSGLEISSLIKNQTDLHTIAYINTEAYSAGTMIALACNEIVMAPSAVIGDCAPIAIDERGRQHAIPAAERAKIESPILADFSDSARRNGYNEMLAEAMVAVGRVVYYLENPQGEKRFVDGVDYERLKAEGWKSVVGVREPVDGAGTLLTVQTNEARKLGLAAGVASSIDALAQERDLEIIRRYVRTAGERVVSALSSNPARFIFLIVFLLSLAIAMHTPGHGGAEAISIISLALLVGLPLLTGYATWLELLIIFGGLALVAFEIFVFPGHFVSGALGVLMVIVGLVLTFVGKEPGGAYIVPELEGTWRALGNGLIVVSAGMTCSLLLWFWLNRFLPKLPYFNRLILTTIAGNVETVNQPAEIGPTVGDVGVAVTDLKPGGSAMFTNEIYRDGRVASVISDSGYVKSGTNVVVHEVGGNRIVVKPIA
jgi:membrane-bound serine protease (ClpP class)